MRKYINAEAMQHAMKLAQMGATVQQINSKMCYVTFDLKEDIKLEYVYNINSKEKYFLERIKPYPLPIKVFDSEEDLIDIIQIDLEQFKSAINSHNLSDFIKINKRLNKTIKKFEDLFLYYNVPTIEMDIIMEEISKIEEEIDKTKEISKRIYFKKDPENL
ncbi:hypothetical protein [Helicovermis profundi]|uniref:Uncharacterized protein n=1 Tax=Helicovermis profundi TaxID=3065157 RepID=A0AAU9EC42_9FIRM|nr:hypothetical protein HLPR_12400 [Clostridia bacterium S502]